MIYRLKSGEFIVGEYDPTTETIRSEKAVYGKELLDEGRAKWVDELSPLNKLIVICLELLCSEGGKNERN